MGVDMSKVNLPTIPPVEAARELRNLMQYLVNNGGTAVGGHVSKLVSIRTRLKNAIGYFNNHQTERAMTNQAIAQVRMAITARRTVEGRKALAKLEEHLRVERAWIDNMRNSVTHAQSTIPLTLDGNDELVRMTREHFDRVYQLSQCFPTQEEVPNGRAENIVRAIVAMLRANDVAGMETVTEKKGANGATG